MFYELTSATVALQFTIIFLSVGIIINSFEYLFNYKLFSSEGLLNWKIIRNHRRDGTLKKMLDFIVEKKLFNKILILRVIAIITILTAPLFSTLFWVSALVIFCSYATTTLVSFYGADGSDQLTNLILVTICLCASPFTNENLLFIGILFIATQSCLSYFVAGFSKLLSKAWRNGSAVQNIFRTRTYGSKKIYKYIKGKKGINLFLCWSVIIIEMAFPLVLFLPLEWGIWFLVWGITFHLLNAFIMGLNTFIWAFLATYPAIIYINFYLAN